MRQWGHEGFHQVVYGKIFVTKISELQAINVMGMVPYSPEISWTGTAAKFMLASMDNSVSIGPSDVFGIVVNLFGAKLAGQTIDPKMFLIILELGGAANNIFSDHLDRNTYYSFVKSDYYQLYLDAEAVKILEEDGLGAVDKDGNFIFDSKWLDEKHKQFSEDAKNDPDAKNPGFGGTQYIYNPSQKVIKEMGQKMDNARERAAKRLDDKVEKYFEDLNKEEKPK